MYLPVFALLHDELILTKSLYSSGDIDEASQHLDKVRMLRSKILRQQRQLREFSLEEWGRQLNLTDSSVGQYLPIAHSCNELLNDIFEWMNAVIGQLDHDDLLQSHAGLNLLLDRQIPPTWDFNYDIIVLYGVDAELFVAPLLDRGQRQIIVIVDGDTNATAEVTNPVPDATVLHVQIGESLTSNQTAALQTTEPPMLHNIVSGADSLPPKEFPRLARQVQKVHVVGGSDRRWPTIFSEQLIGNLPRFIGKNSVYHIASEFIGKDILIVSPGPSLADSLPHLKRFREKFVVISLVRSLQVLFDSQILPDFAIMVDAQDHSEAGLNLIPTHSMLSEVPLIVTEYIHKSTFDFNFKEIFILPAAQLIGSPLSIAIHGGSPPTVNGSSVATFAISLAAELCARSITLVGQDLSIAHGRYVTDETTNAVSDGVGDLTCTGIDGSKLATKADYLLFISELEALAKAYGGNVAIFNCTLFGAYLEGWQHIPLDEDHPVVAGNLKELSERAEFSGKFIDTNKGGMIEASVLQDAIEDEIGKLRIVHHLSASILEELDKLLASGSSDVTVLEELEEQLLTQMSAVGSLITFYTTPSKLATEATLQSVESLTDNFVASSDYYGFIAASAKRLIEKFGDLAFSQS